YDANGDLVSYTDRETNTTSFAYEAEIPHHLKEIHDPLGRTPIRNDYYPDGRIKSHTDAFGRRSRTATTSPRGRRWSRTGKVRCVCWRTTSAGTSRRRRSRTGRSSNGRSTRATTA